MAVLGNLTFAVEKCEMNQITSGVGVYLEEMSSHETLEPHCRGNVGACNLIFVYEKYGLIGDLLYFVRGLFNLHAKY